MTTMIQVFGRRLMRVWFTIFVALILQSQAACMDYSLDHLTAPSDTADTTRGWHPDRSEAAAGTIAPAAVLTR